MGHGSSPRRRPRHPLADLTRLRSFRAIAEAASFTRAARRLGVSQPSLSVQIAALETQLGGALFKREPGGVILTALGRRLLDLGGELLTRADELERALRSEVIELAGEIKVGSVHSVGIHILPETLGVLARRHPQLRPALRLEHSDVVLDLLHRGRIDLAVTAHGAPPPTGHHELVLDDPIVLVCGPRHRWWRRKRVEARDFAGERLVGFDLQSPTAKLVERVLAARRIKLEAVVRAPQIAALVRMVRLNLGIGFLPRMAVTEAVQAGGLHAIAFAAEDLHRGIYASWEERSASPPREAFLAALHEVAGERSRRGR